VCHSYGAGESRSKFDGGLCDNSKGPFCSNEKLSKVETSRRLMGSPSCLDHFSRRKNNRLIQFKRNNQAELNASFTTFKNHSALAVPYRTAFAFQIELDQKTDKSDNNLLPEQPVASIPPTVAPGAGSS
jgi:hypothetical protein